MVKLIQLQFNYQIMKISIRRLSLSLFCLFFAVPALGNPATQSTLVKPWVIDERRDEFDDRLLSLSTLANDVRGNGGWLSATCQLDKKLFTLNIVSTEYGRRLESIDDQKNNLKYIIDDGQPQFVTTIQIIQGTAISNDLNSKIVTDIMSGGKTMKVKFLGDTNSGPVVKFDIAGAQPAIDKILKSCR
jgi:hypothetical protein